MLYYETLLSVESEKHLSMGFYNIRTTHELELIHHVHDLYLI